MAVPYTFIKTPEEARKALADLSKQNSIGYDTETTGVDPHTDKVILASFATSKHAYVVDTRNLDLLRIFAPILESEAVIKIQHNGIFDYQMTKGSIGVDTENNVCTMLGERTLTAGLQFGGLSLEDVTKKYLNKSRDKTLQKSFIGHTGDFTKEQIEYSAEDAFDLAFIARAQQEEAQKLGVLRTWKTENAALPAFGDIEFYGQRLDPDAWREIMDQNKEAERLAKKELDAWFIPIVGREQIQFDLMDSSKMYEEPGAAINYNSQPAVLYALQMMNLKIDGKLITDTSKKTQNRIKDHPVIQSLMKYRRAVKLYGTYGQSYIDAIHPLTRRVHFRFKQYGTDTGRPACRDGLNCLNIPRDQRYRKAFGTEDGRLISTVDYSAAELRILADLSNDRLMVDGFNSGIDFHCYVATMIFGKEVTKTNENKHLREPTKTLNFGIAYGMSPRSLWEKLNFELGQKISIAECEELFNGYKRTFRTAIEWLECQQQLASTQFTMSNINGRRRGWFPPNHEKIQAEVRNELTRNGKLEWTDDMDSLKVTLVREKQKAHLAAIQREGANCQIQSVNADFTKLSMAAMRKEFKKRGFDGRMYNSVYDEIVTDHDAGTAKEAHELKQKIMIEEANKMLQHVPMLVEGHLDKVWKK